MTTEFVRQDLAQNSSTTAEPDRVRVIRDGVASYLPDIDPEESALARKRIPALVNEQSFTPPAPQRASVREFT